MAGAVRIINVDGERAGVWVVELVRSRVVRRGRVYWAEVVDVVLMGFVLN